MIINVGSKNKNKVDAVKEIILEYDFLKDADVVSIEVSSGVSDQPKSAEETIQGAKNRAINSFKDCDLSIGYESGLIRLPETKTGYANIDVCAIYDGNKFHLGFAPMFEYPIEATKMVFNEGLDMSQAFFKNSLTEKENIGAHEGIVGFLTKGRMTRKEFTMHGIRMALIHLEFPELY
ncbi:MAG: inosine/xanthosine triphosphatase [archaeon]